MPSKLGAGGRTMPLPEEVYRRLTARAVTDPDVASLLAQFTKPDEATAGEKTRPGTGSLHPVAIGAAVEATKPLKPPVKRVA